mmetsp:Transcript_25000/g.54371  ORF Transcript_25000/g.54371 Transcript_25000/m.54371 type:complete len:457 (+) Transcript_25000:156-1526(+)|eukprot:CAMPEP_0202892134 /NCGR_PEP_ID=MMETSP1392-20130828/1947_1 /ASSEMBLY_ACC=CAM_ASM_000868 /TAXON_ID=225041 /ORGANISM="Chlamydomonas chlamydogama, Strain SAG 11-48b" /LENGTH=456 /DNA_ID=CAMNT_0049576015 /DNA_START=154 /DNA_END=1524 /DNA_ORIENTATION=-
MSASASTSGAFPFVDAGWWQRNKKSVFGTAVAAAAAYAAYKAYNSEGLGKAKEQVQRMREAFANYSKAASSLSSVCSLVASDLHTFLNSDSTELPQSLKQLNRLLQSQDVQQTLQTAVSTVVRGASEAAASVAASSATEGSASALDKIIEAVLSDRGRSLIGMAVGLASKNATSAFCDFLERSQASSQGSGGVTLEKVMQLLVSEQGEKLLSLMITSSIKTTVNTYVESTLGYNFYDDMLASITKQEHRDAMTDIMTRVTVAFCREVAAAVRKSRAPANTREVQQSYGCMPTGAIAEPTNAAGDSPLSRGSLDLASCSPASSTASTTSTASCSALVPRPGGAPPAYPSAQQQQQPRMFKQNTLRPPPAVPPPWIKQVVDLAREQDVRSLTVDIVRSATREATRGALETLLAPIPGESMSGRFTGLTASLSAYRLYILLTVAISLFMYSTSPRTIAM